MRCQMKNLRKTKRFQRSVRNSLEIMGELKGSVSVFLIQSRRWGWISPDNSGTARRKALIRTSLPIIGRPVPGWHRTVSHSPCPVSYHKHQGVDHSVTAKLRKKVVFHEITVQSENTGFRRCLVYWNVGFEVYLQLFHEVSKKKVALVSVWSVRVVCMSLLWV